MNSRPSRRTIVLELLLPAAVGLTLAMIALVRIDEPLGRALGMVVAVVVLLPLAMSARRFGPHRLSIVSYTAAALPVFVATLCACGFASMAILFAVALSLIAGPALLPRLRVRIDLAIGLTIASALVAFTWPIWMSGILARVELGPWLQRMVDVSPAFALNAAIAPYDPLTHRPLMYRLTNLGQDVSYTLPSSLWPCVLLHAGMGIVGLVGGFVGRGWTRIDADEEKEPLIITDEHR